jgi:hypothetical protein
VKSGAEALVLSRVRAPVATFWRVPDTWLVNPCTSDVTITQKDVLNIFIVIGQDDRREQVPALPNGANLHGRGVVIAHDVFSLNSD